MFAGAVKILTIVCKQNHRAELYVRVQEKHRNGLEIIRYFNRKPGSGRGGATGAGAAPSDLAPCPLPPDPRPRPRDPAASPPGPPPAVPRPRRRSVGARARVPRAPGSPGGGRDQDNVLVDVIMHSRWIFFSYIIKGSWAKWALWGSPSSRDRRSWLVGDQIHGLWPSSGILGCSEGRVWTVAVWTQDPGEPHHSSEAWRES